jgi:nucleoside-diphosphate-sugar epimerase
MARAAAAAGAHNTMLSTRKVYSAEDRWGATEETPAEGDETAYGRNKALTEKAVRAACGERLGIFRLSNVFGYEYSHPVPRRSFLGQLLFSLKQKNVIFFDMHPSTQRDFIPVETCARLLAARAAEGYAGTLNLGSGFAIPCGDLASWVMEGFGGGELICDPMQVRDEFFLNMDQWRSRFPLAVSEAELRDYCVALGRRLKCEKS